VTPHLSRLRDKRHVPKVGSIATLEATQRTPGGKEAATSDNLASMTILSSTITPEELETRVGLTPARAWSKKSPDEKGKGRKKFNGVSYESTLPRSADLDEHLEQLLQMLAPKAPAIRELAVAIAGSPVDDTQPESINLHLQASAYKDLVCFTFSPPSMKQVAELGVDLNLSVQFWSGDEEGRDA
jgi:Domain of unknown function (DUF4279)